MTSIKYILICLTITFLTSCVSKKKIVYFQNDEINQELVSNDFVTTFKSDDLLQITISAKELESVAPFNLPVANFMQVGKGMGQMQQQTYLIDSKGYIDFPVLGKLKIGGKTREEVVQMFKDKLDPDYVKNPTINIFIANFRVTVSGDVARPGTFTIPNERISIVEALGLAGDLNPTGQRNNIKVIREEGGKKKIITVNLLSKEVFTSPVYYLQQNDLVYVEPNQAKSQYAAYNPNTGLFVSIASLLITLITLITR